MAGLLAPQDTQAVDRNSFFSRVWYSFFHDMSKRLNNASRVTEVATVDAVDPTTTQDLVNELKAVVNQLSAAMRGEEVT